MFNLNFKQNQIKLSSLFIALLLLVTPIDVALTFQNFGNTTIVNYLIVIIDLLVLIEIFKKKKITFSIPLKLASIFFVYACFFMIPELTSFYQAGRRPFALINCYIMYALLTLNDYSEKDSLIFVYSSALSIAIAGIIFYNNFNILDLGNVDRVFLKLGKTIDPNTVTTNFVLALAALFEIYNLKTRKYVKCVIFILGIVLFFIVFLLASRGAILGLLTVCVVNLFLRNNKANIQKIISFILIVSVILTLFLFASNILPEKMVERFHFSNMVKGQGSGRLPIWKNSIHNYFFNLKVRETIFGTGFGTFIDVSPIRRESHNIYLSLLIETGFLGLVMFFLFLFQSLKTAYSSKNTFAFSALLGLSICGLSLEMGTLRIFWLTLWLCNSTKATTKHKTKQFHLLIKSVKIDCGQFP